MTPQEITEALMQIPHLPLPVSIDLARLQAEVADAGEDYVSFETTTQANNWLNLEVNGVIDYKIDPKFAGESSFRFLKPEQMGQTKTSPTTLGVTMPYTTGLIYELGETPERCRLSRLKAMHDVPWHDHMQRHRYNHLVIHIPVTTNEQVVFAVRGANKIAYTKHYAAGSVWVLNTWLEHAVFNPSPHDRIHLWLNYYVLDRQGNVVNQRLLDILGQAINDYDGVLLRKVVK